MEQLDLPPKAEHAFQRLQDTDLSPMEEALFKAWTKANQIEDPDAPDDTVDYRGIWKATNGHVLPPGELKKTTEVQNLSNTLERALQERMMKRITELTGKAEDFEKDKFDAERQDITHQQKIEQGDQKLKQAPFDLKMRAHDIEGKQFDIEKQKLGLDQQKLGNEGKELDLVSNLLMPTRQAGPNESKGVSNESGTNRRT